MSQAYGCSAVVDLRKDKREIEKTIWHRPCHCRCTICQWQGYRTVTVLTELKKELPVSVIDIPVRGSPTRPCPKCQGKVALTCVTYARNRSRGYNPNTGRKAHKNRK